jgi:asparagine synthase (glutamine-hydrolysing)
MLAPFAVAWGRRALELLERHAPPADLACERVEQEGIAIAVRGARGAEAGSWRCWLSGRLSNGAEIPDAQVAAQALARHGLEGVSLLRGTFVLVALDRERRRCAVVRDQLGGRPLLYTRVGGGGGGSGGGVLLAEHERAIVELMPSTPAPDRLALAQWIEQGRTPARRTLFAGVERIAPGELVLLERERPPTLQTYWQPSYEGVADGSREELCERLRSAAFEAVARAAGGAQTPALLLSGGLDSSCVAAGLAASGTAGLTLGATAPAGASSAAIALSGVFPSRPETDERELIEATARHTGLRSELIAFDESASILVPALEHLERWLLPPATPNLFAWQPVMARARELGVDAMLDGEGGDELFGFARHLVADRLRAGRLLSAWRLTGRIPGVGADADAGMRLRALRVYGVSPLLPDRLRDRRALARSLDSPRSLLRAEDELALSELERSAPSRTPDGPLWWRDLAARLARPGETLGVSAHLRREAAEERIDRRHPFLYDVELLSVALRTPPQLLFDVRDRALLRDALRGHIPEAVRARNEKSIFNGLLQAGLERDGASLASGPSQADAPVREYVRAERLAPLLEQAATPRDGGAARRLWQAGLADAWLRSLERPQHPSELRERATTRT